MGADKLRLLAALFVVAIGSASRAGGEIIFESAASGPTGQVSGAYNVVDSASFLGVNFQITSTVTTGSVGGHLNDFDEGAPIFGAIVALDGPSDVPNSSDLSSGDLLGAALIAPLDPSENVAGNLRLRLTPGWYALVLGSGRFGASGEAGAWSNNIPDGRSQIYAIRQSDGLVIPQSAGARLFVASSPVPSFTRIADTNTIIPGGDVAFTGTAFPSMRDGSVVFVGFGPAGSGPLRSGIYTSAGGILESIANLGTPVPGGSGMFVQFSPAPKTSGGAVVFRGSGGMNQRQGIYIFSDDGPSVVADSNTPIPGGAGNFEMFFAEVSIHDGDVAFAGRGGNPQVGVYALIDGAVSVVADVNTPIPGGIGNFDFLPLQYPPIDDGKVSFVGGSVAENVAGIYTNLHGPLSVVVDFMTPIPGGTLNFGNVGIGALRNGRFAFYGADAPTNPTEAGIFTDVSGMLSPVVTLATPVPEGTGPFTAFIGPAFDGAHVAFIGLESSGRRGIYTNLTGPLTKIIATGDRLDGRTVNASQGVTLSINDGLDGYRMAFLAGFTDGSRGVYVAEYPPAPGDIDADGDVDLADVALYMVCFGGPDGSPAPAECRHADANGDTDVDSLDFRVFPECLSGPDFAPVCVP